jgi:hypothetical protein
MVSIIHAGLVTLYLKAVDGRKGCWSVSSGLGQEQMLKGGRPSSTGSKVVKIPEFSKESRNTGVRVGATLVLTFVLNDTLANPRRQENSRNTNTKTSEVKGGVLSVMSQFSVGQAITGRNIDRREDVIGKTATLVEGKNKEGLVPLRSSAKGFVNALEETLTQADRRGRVHRVVTAAFRVDIGESRKAAACCVIKEVLDALDVGIDGSTGDGPVVENGIRVETGDGLSRLNITGSITRGVGVVDPGDVLLGQLLEDGLLWETTIVE